MKKLREYISDKYVIDKEETQFGLNKNKESNEEYLRSFQENENVEEDELVDVFESIVTKIGYLDYRDYLVLNKFVVDEKVNSNNIAKVKKDDCVFNACKNIWNNIVNKKLYITGGIGSTAVGEAFSFDYDLPNDLAYCETCASIGLAMFSRRMFEINPISSSCCLDLCP